MEAPDSLVVSRVVSLGDGARRRSASTLISRLRVMVREARAACPELAGYRLCDIGLRRRGGELTVNLYFRR